VDAGGHATIVRDDGEKSLLVTGTRDALGNETIAQHDYRVLQVHVVTDPNGNRQEARYDALGMLAGTAAQGKAQGPVEGDSFASFQTDLSMEAVAALLDAPDPFALALHYLGTASTRIVYDLARIPTCVVTIARETHVSDLKPGHATRLQLRFLYSDGFGREAQSRIQAEPGPLDLEDREAPVLPLRWVATGAKQYNNKGKPLRQFEPFFSASHAFGIERHGVSNTLLYDAPGRVVATLRPNHTYEKTVFNACLSKTGMSTTRSCNPIRRPTRMSARAFSVFRHPTICQPGTNNVSKVRSACLSRWPRSALPPTRTPRQPHIWTCKGASSCRLPITAYRANT
jgi:hypothetical protein